MIHARIILPTPLLTITFVLHDGTVHIGHWDKTKKQFCVENSDKAFHWQEVWHWLPGRTNAITESAAASKVKKFFGAVA